MAAGAGFEAAGACGAGVGADAGAGVASAAGAAGAGAAGAGAAGRAAGAGPGRAPCGRRGPGFAAGAGRVDGAAPPPLGNFSFSRRMTGGSTVELAERTNSPISLSVVSTTLLSTPNSLASS